MTARLGAGHLLGFETSRHGVRSRLLAGAYAFITCWNSSKVLLDWLKSVTLPSSSTDEAMSCPSPWALTLAEGGGVGESVVTRPDKRTLPAILQPLLIILIYVTPFFVELNEFPAPSQP